MKIDSNLTKIKINIIKGGRYFTYFIYTIHLERSFCNFATGQILDMNLTARSPNRVRSQMKTRELEEGADRVTRQHNFGRTRSGNEVIERKDDKTKLHL